MQDIIRRTITKIKEGMLKEMWIETKWIYQYTRRYFKSIIAYTLLGLVGTAVSLASSLVSRNLVDIITGHQTGLLIRTFCMFIGFNIGNIILTQISTYISSWINIRVDNEIKADIFDKILITDWESLTVYHTGDLLTRWNADASNISSGILNWIPNLIIYSTRFISTFAMVLYYDPTFAMLAMLGIPVSLFMSRTMMRRMKNNNRRSAAMNAKMTGFNQETFSNIQTIKAFDLLTLYSKRLRSLQQEYLTMRMDFQKLSAINSIILSVIGIAISYLCYGWGIYRVWNDSISYGTMTMFLSLSGSLTGTSNSLISLIPSALTITTSAGRIMDILNMPKEDYSDAGLVDDLYQSSCDTGISLSFEHLSYSYHTGTQVFSDASFAAHPHEIVALVGPSGEGKTTMLRLILSLLSAKEGTCIVYPGTDDSASLPLSPAARRLFSYVPQGNTMFSGTIAENLRSVKPDATDEEIISALKSACAWDFVSHLADGINSKVGERGGGFSEGQAQRLSIARALLRRSPILLLDEATSALDVATERRVLKNIMQDEYPRTCVVTTHRPTVLGICHKVYSIQNKQCRLLTPDEITALEKDF